MIVSSVVGAIALGIAIVLWWWAKRGRVLTVCCLLFGFAIAWPLSHVFAGPLAQIDQVASWVLISLTLAAAASTWLFFELKNPGTQKFTPWIALVTPALFVLAAGPFLLPLEIVGGVTGTAEDLVMQMGR
jgi:hypothetical protein